jgi:hypothetical protein
MVSVTIKSIGSVRKNEWGLLSNVILRLISVAVKLVLLW